MMQRNASRTHAAGVAITVVLIALATNAATGRDATTAKGRDATTPTIVYAVRHAEKGGAAGEKDPPLSAAGMARARTLATMLADVKFDAIYVSPYRRTQQTAAPLAQALNLTPIVLASDSVAAHILQEDRGKTLLVIGHSNTVPALLAGLGVRDSIAIADTQYDNLFILSRDVRQVVLQHLHYGTPDAPVGAEPHPAPATADTNAVRAPRG